MTKRIPIVSIALILMILASVTVVSAQDCTVKIGTYQKALTDGSTRPVVQVTFKNFECKKLWEGSKKNRELLAKKVIAWEKNHKEFSPYPKLKYSEVRDFFKNDKPYDSGTLKIRLFASAKR